MVNPQFTQADTNVINNEWVENVSFNETPVETIVEVPLHLHDHASSSNPVKIYESTHPHYRPIINSVLRHHPVAQLKSYNCGLKPLKPFWHFWPINKEWDIRKIKHWNQIVAKMQWKRFWSACGAGRAWGRNAHWSGMVHPSLAAAQANTSAVNGMAFKHYNNLPLIHFGGVQATIMRGIDNYTHWENSRGGRTFAHELGHLKGLDHVCTMNSPDNQDPNYPYPDDCSFSIGNHAFFSTGHDGYYGLDIYHDYFGLEQPTIIGDVNSDVPWINKASPTMSYSPNKRWLSPYSYCKLLNYQGVYCNASLISSRYKKKPTTIATHQKKVSSIPSAISADRSFKPTIEESENIKLDFNTKNRLPTDGDLVSRFTKSSIVVSGVFDLANLKVDNLILMKTTEKVQPTLEAYDRNLKIENNLRGRDASELQSLFALTINQLYKGRITQTNLIPLQHTDGGNSNTSGYYPVFQLINLSGKIDKLEVVYNNEIIASHTISKNPPVINLEPILDQNITSRTTLNWRAEDADGDDLTYSVFYSHDNGENWILVDSEVTSKKYDLIQDIPATIEDPLMYYRGTQEGKFKVVAFDGFHTTSDSTQRALIVPGSKPRVTILQQSGMSAFQGETVYLNAAVTDIEDGPLTKDNIQLLPLDLKYHSKEFSMPIDVDSSGYKLSWKSSIDGNLSILQEVRTRKLSVGKHTITLTARDSEGMIGSNSIELTIKSQHTPLHTR